MSRLILLTAFFFLFIFNSQGQEVSLSRTISWETHSINDSARFYLSFKGASYQHPEAQLPEYFENIALGNLKANPQSVSLADAIYKEIEFPATQVHFLPFITDTAPSISSNVFTARENNMLSLSFLPLRLNPASGNVEKLISFKLKFEPEQQAKEKSGVEPKYQIPENSVLSTGDWYKIKITETGIYKLTFEELQQLGIANPSDVRVYGNGGRPLPVMNAEPRPFDLLENAIYFEEGSDGTFNQGDYILFYAEGPEYWNYHEGFQMFMPEINPYSTASYYFLTSSLGKGKVIQPAPIVQGTPTHQVTEFDDRYYYEKEEFNLLGSGARWFSDVFNSNGSKEISFNIPDVATTKELKAYVSVAAHSRYTTGFSVSAGNTEKEFILPSVNIRTSTGAYASTRSEVLTWLPNSNNQKLEIDFLNGGDPNAIGWLDKVSLMATRNLRFTGEPLFFRNTKITGNGNIAEYYVSNTTSNTHVWDISDPNNILSVSRGSQNQIEFKSDASYLREFVAFNKNGNFKKPVINEEGLGKISSQNLKNLPAFEMLIVTAPEFIEQANELANLHRDIDNMNVLVLTPDIIYNEFSSGKRDAGAIRDFLKYCYDKAETDAEKPRYLLLFGDGSYANRHDHPKNPNFLPTYQSSESIVKSRTFVTDDFYGLMDDSEGGSIGLVDIGVGRLPVKDTDEADNALRKIKTYVSQESMDDWRNVICFIGDDEDGRLHMSQSDDLSEKVNSKEPAFITPKIFLDAYPQVSNATGNFYPDVNKEINDRINQGALIINYTGHGGEQGLAHEKIVTIPQINAWSNGNKLPVFVTATCEFSRYDNVKKSSAGFSEETSAGEYVFLSTKGGAVALFTTSRLVYAHSNFTLNNAFYDYAFEKDSDGNRYKLGDIIRLAKNNTDGNVNKRNFALLGDPALTLAYPAYRVHTDSIQAATGDTLKALGKATIYGHVSDNNGNIQENFNGTAYITVFDKKQEFQTLANDKGASPYTFFMQNNSLYKGSASVVDGKFSVSFILPKDINYDFGNGKISYYAVGEGIDAHGYYDSIIIGGLSDEAEVDVEGPQISLYMNDTLFRNGGITDSSPLLLASVQDENGINTSNSGIGHDITLVLSNNPDEKIIVNDFYRAKKDVYNSGTISYPLSGLAPGTYTATLKVWDVYNNSNEETITFVVTNDGDAAIKNLVNYPNPFAEETYFEFEHNMAGDDLEADIYIYNFSGKVVRILNWNGSTEGYKTAPIRWDGRDLGGNKLPAGLYIYKVNLKNNIGHSTQKSGKMMIIE